MVTLPRRPAPFIHWFVHAQCPFKPASSAKQRSNGCVTRSLAWPATQPRLVTSATRTTMDRLPPARYLDNDLIRVSQRCYRVHSLFRPASRSDSFVLCHQSIICLPRLRDAQGPCRHMTYRTSISTQFHRTIPLFSAAGAHETDSLAGLESSGRFAPSCLPTASQGPLRPEGPRRPRWGPRWAATGQTQTAPVDDGSGPNGSRSLP